MGYKNLIVAFCLSLINISLFGATPAGDDFLSTSRDEGIDAAVYTFEKNGEIVVQLDAAFSGNWSAEEISILEENVNVAVAKKRVSFIGISKGTTTYFDIAFVKDENGAIRASSYKRAESKSFESAVNVCY